MTRQTMSLMLILLAALAASAADVESVTIILGSKDNEPTRWNGSASISGGEIVRVKGHHFRAEDKIVGHAWECATHPWPTNKGGMHPNEGPQPHQTIVIPTGVTIEFTGSADTEIHIQLEPESFTFRPADIPENGAIYPLRGMIEVRRTPVIERVTDERFQDDYPSVAADGSTVWTAWMAHDGKSERIFVRARQAGQWQAPVEVTERPGDLFGTAVVAAGGRATVFWSEHVGDAWAVWARTVDGTNLGPVETVSGSGRNLFHRAAAEENGNIHVAYQSWRKGRSDIFLRSRRGGNWGPELNLSDPKRPVRANDWSPAVAVDSAGTVWVAWDGYARGSYNIYMRSVRNGNVGPLLPVTDSDRFHAHPSLAIDGQDRVWIAWDEAPENWGKDVGFLLTGGTGLYHARDIRVAVYFASQWMEPVQQPTSVVPWGFKRYFHTPRLSVDSGGRVWLFARPRTECRIPHSIWAAGGKWEVVATYFAGDRWSDLIPIPESVAGNEGDLQVTPGDGGQIFLAALTDNRLWGGPNFGEKPGDHDIIFARLSASAEGSALLASRRAEAPTASRADVLEQEHLARIRGYEVVNEGATYHIFRGDLHRHTDHSTDGSGDGSLWDAYRYALDGANLDYFLVTDHHSMLTPYYYQRNEKAVDMFDVPGFFTPLYGYERSLSYPNGHRNIIFTKRGIPLLDTAPDEPKGSTGPVLYPYLRQYTGLATSHTSHTGMGTDWRDNDPALEPIVEIFQGARTSAEHEGAPLAPTEKRTELHAGGYRPLGFVWNAWKKGYKLGVQASSDHVSTHTSYACVLATDDSREALVDAMRRRHTYAATTNIIMDYRLEMDGKTHLQGDIVEGQSLPQLSARIIGTAPLKEVVIIRDNEYVYSAHPGEESYLLSFKETSLSPGEHYYYVRVEQTDGNVAWSSPVWVKR